MNILTFDIEEWYIELAYHGDRSEKYQEYNNYLNSILDILDSCNTKASFFCLGEIASKFPYVVKKIAEKGHEIACHSDKHSWLTKLSEAELREDTLSAIKALEDVSGQKVESYRAPAFSIGENNKWAFEVLAECGITRDASIFPASRDFGGFASFSSKIPTVVQYRGVSIKEFPICTASILGKELAYSGGGYFRFFTYSFVRDKMKHSEYGIAYFHIGDLIHNKGGVMSKFDYETYFKEPGTLQNRLIRYVKSNLGTKHAFDKMSKLIYNIDFINVSQADSLIEWDKMPQIIL